MTSREELKILVDELHDDDAAELLGLARDLYAVPGQRRPLPAFVGIGDSGRSDVSRRADELLADGFGTS